jgi:hypothetical protein
MTLQEWNPLSFFKELGTFPKILLLLGFVFLGVGIAQGLSPYNRTVVSSLVMVAFSLTAHYLSQWLYPVQVNGRISVKWGNLLGGLVMLGVTFALGWWLWVISGRPTQLPFRTAELNFVMALPCSPAKLGQTICASLPRSQPRDRALHQPRHGTVST